MGYRRSDWCGKSEPNGEKTVYPNGFGKKIKKTEVVVEKISFLAVGKQKDKESEMEWD